eukprot:TRINITY_DN23563_c0_g1_i1.p1 TRINITY_DN23563_c0_g1~~TRINITY_DN23563_c0_g1_i1.p1  ORF type:complete len:195 (+),score=2.78 TRINITY_DN23563_c0_g1_i1:110-694(+)
MALRRIGNAFIGGRMPSTSAFKPKSSIPLRHVWINPGSRPKFNMFSMSREPWARPASVYNPYSDSGDPGAGFGARHPLNVSPKRKIPIAYWILTMGVELLIRFGWAAFLIIFFWYGCYQFGGRLCGFSGQYHELKHIHKNVVSSVRDYRRDSETIQHNAAADVFSRRISYPSDDDDDADEDARVNSAQSATSTS